MVENHMGNQGTPVLERVSQSKQVQPSALYVVIAPSISVQVSLSVSTEDVRGQPLVFKAALFQMRDNLLLVEFRRSKVLAVSVCVLVMYVPSSDMAMCIVCEPY